MSNWLDSDIYKARQKEREAEYLAMATDAIRQAASAICRTQVTDASNRALNALGIALVALNEGMRLRAPEQARQIANVLEIASEDII